MRVKVGLIGTLAAASLLAGSAIALAEATSSTRQGVARDSVSAPPGVRSSNRTTAARSTDHRRGLESTLQEIESYRNWMIGANNKSPVAGILNRGVNPKTQPQHFYNMKNLEHKRFLQYERQGTGRGMNIGWTDNASAQTANGTSHWGFFPKNAGGLRANINGVRRGEGIVYGEIIAIGWWPPKQQRTYSEFSAVQGVNVPQFLTKTSRKVGPNMEWSKKGVSYEWVVLGGKPGTAVRGGDDPVVLFNLKSKQPLLYGSRQVGAHVGFHKYKSLLGRVVRARPDITLAMWRTLMLKPAQDATR